MLALSEHKCEAAKPDLLGAALREYGITEVTGNVHNLRILQYSKELKLDWVKDDETAWCGIFMGYLHHKLGLKAPAQPALARNWLSVGEPTSDPKLGDLVVFWRDSLAGTSGHVGIYINYSEDGNNIYVLGGNQSNQVNITPYRAERVLGFRRTN